MYSCPGKIDTFLVPSKSRKCVNRFGVNLSGTTVRYSLYLVLHFNHVILIQIIHVIWRSYYDPLNVDNLWWFCGNINSNLFSVLVMANGETRSQPILMNFQGSSNLSSLMSEWLKLFLRKYRKESTSKLRKRDRRIFVMWSYIKWTILAYWW